MTDVFSSSSYKDFLTQSFPVKGDGRGLRRALAEAIGCQPGFVSQVLSGDLHFSQEQLVLTADYLELDETETDFLVLLHGRDRAGTKKLRDFYARKIQRELEKRNEIQARIQKRRETPEEIANEYYSHWMYTAAHMAARNPKLASADSIAAYLRIPSRDARRALDLLWRGGFVELGKDKVRATDQRVHLHEKSVNLQRHHVNWRLDAIQAIQDAPKAGLHYSSIMSISKEAHAKIEALLLKAIENAEPVIRDAKDEQVSALLIDLYPLKRS